MRFIDFVKVAMAGLILLGCWTGSIYGQEQEDVYVDAPIGEGAQPAENQVSLGTEYVEQFNLGIRNYGYIEPVYLKYSGNSIFEDGNSPTEYFRNIGWNHIIPLDYKYLPAVALGLEFLYFSSASDSVYSGEEEEVIGPSIDMNLLMGSGSFRMFFMDPFKEFLHPFFGLGWGIISGNINTIKVGGEKYTTTFMGVLAYRMFGTQIKLSDRGGLFLELRSQSATAIASNDPFGQAKKNEDLTLNFDGVMVSLTGYYRY